jgi:hypothetical protein
MEPTDNNLCELFSRQRVEDQRHLPPFEAIALARSSPQVARLRPALCRFQLAAGLTAGMAMLVATGLIVSQIRHRSFEKEMQQWASLSEWAATTDSFLNQPGLALNETITDSFLNLQTQTAESSSSPNQ